MIATSAEVTPHGGLVGKFSQKKALIREGADQTKGKGLNSDSGINQLI